MPATVLTFTIEEAKATEYIKLFCEEANLEATPANAKKVAKTILESYLAEAKRRRIPPSTVEGIT